MQNHDKSKKIGFATRAVHAGNDVDQDNGAIKRPITMANSYALPYDPTDVNWSSAGGIFIPVTEEQPKNTCRSALLHWRVEDCVVLASGVAALSGLF